MDLPLSGAVAPLRGVKNRAVSLLGRGAVLLAVGSLLREVGVEHPRAGCVVAVLGEVFLD